MAQMPNILLLEQVTKYVRKRSNVSSIIFHALFSHLFFLLSFSKFKAFYFLGLGGKNNFQGIFQGPGRKFSNSSCFPGTPGAVPTLQLAFSSSRNIKFR